MALATHKSKHYSNEEKKKIWELKSSNIRIKSIVNIIFVNRINWDTSLFLTCHGNLLTPSGGNLPPF